MNTISHLGLAPSVQGLSGSPSPGAGPIAPDSQPGSQPAFKNMLLEAINEVNQMQQQADQAVQSWATGGDVNPAEVLTAVQKADLSFRMMMQVRNKMVQAFDEIRNIRV